MSQLWTDHHPVTVLCAMEGLYRLLDLYMIRSRIGYGTIVNKHPELESAVVRAIEASSGQHSNGNLTMDPAPVLSRFDSSGSVDTDTPVLSVNVDVRKYFQDCEGQSEELSSSSPQQSDVNTLLGKLTQITQRYDSGRAVHVAIRALALALTILKCRQI